MALRSTLHRRAVAEGSIVLPAVPALLDDYVTLCLDTFRALGVTFNATEVAHLRKVLDGQLVEAFAASPRSEIVITYDAPVGAVVNYHVQARALTVEQAYNAWTTTREPPFFGTEPDAKVVELARRWSEAREWPVLDIGAGTGRNALALASLGHPVDALEMSGGFVDALREQAHAAGLDVRVIPRDFRDAKEDLRQEYGLIVLSEVMTDFRTLDDVRALFELVAEVLAGEGRLVLNAFLPRGDYEPDEIARQLGQQLYSSIFTRSEIMQAGCDCGLVLEEDTSVLEFERAHLPAASWPPTRWYEGWVGGVDVFGNDAASSPIELRWLVFRKVTAMATGEEGS